jgi:hypothetical protein
VPGYPGQCALIQSITNLWKDGFLIVLLSSGNFFRARILLKSTKIKCCSVAFLVHWFVIRWGMVYSFTISFLLFFCLWIGYTWRRVKLEIVRCMSQISRSLWPTMTSTRFSGSMAPWSSKFVIRCCFYCVRLLMIFICNQRVTIVKHRLTRKSKGVAFIVYKTRGSQFESPFWL